MKDVVDEEYYIICAKCYECRTHDGNDVLTKEDEIVWFGDATGYRQLYTTKGYALRFEDIPPKSELLKYSGKPWYHEIKPETIQVFKVRKTVTTFYEEKEILLDE